MAKRKSLTKAQFLDELLAMANDSEADADRIRAMSLYAKCKRFDLPAKRTTNPKIPADPIEAAKYRLRDVRRRIMDANGIAFNQLEKTEARLVSTITRMENENRDLAALEDMPQEQWHERLRADAEDMPLCDLEVYVKSYLSQTGAAIVGPS